MGISMVDGLRIRCGCEESRLVGAYTKYARICCAVCHLENTQHGEINE